MFTIKQFGFCILALVFTLGHSVLAKEKSVTRSQLDEVFSFYKGIEELEVLFRQEKKLQGLTRPLKSEGVLKTKGDSGNETVSWEIQKPSQVLVVLTPTEMTMTGGGSSQTFQTGQFAQTKEGKSLQSLAAWLKMDSEPLFQTYKISDLGSRTFQFVPIEKESSPFVKLEMKLSEKKYVSELKIFESSGDELHIFFESPKVTFKKENKAKK